MAAESFVSKEMTIGDVVSKYPETANVMQSFGLHCVGCHVNPFESLAQGAMGHGMPEDIFEDMLKEVNKLVVEKYGSDAKSHPKTPQKNVQKNNTEQILSQKISMTSKAAERVADFREKEGKSNEYGLRVSASPGGCAGFMYRLEFDTPKEEDMVIDQGKVNLIVSQEQVPLLKGVVIDFVDSLEGSGFKIENPNSTGSCGCGKSFH